MGLRVEICTALSLPAPFVIGTLHFQVNVVLSTICLLPDDVPNYLPHSHLSLSQVNTRMIANHTHLSTTPHTCT